MKFIIVDLKLMFIVSSLIDTLTPFKRLMDFTLIHIKTMKFSSQSAKVLNSFIKYQIKYGTCKICTFNT